MGQGFERKIVKNTLFSLWARVCLFVISIFLTPYILGRLGNVEYGVWVLIGALVNYTTLLDFGFGTSFVKYIAEYDARGDQEGVNGVLSAGLIVYLIISVVVIAVAYPNIDIILGFFPSPPGMEEQTRFVLKLGIIALLWGNCIGVYQSVINGLQRMDISNGIIVFLVILNAVGNIIVLELGFGLKGLAVNQLITHGIGTVVTVYFTYRLCSYLRFDFKAAEKYFLTLLRYGLNLQVSNIAVLTYLQFDKLLIGWYIGVSHVAFYEIGSRITVSLRSFPAQLLPALIPASSELAVREGKAEVYELFYRTSKYVSIVAFPLFTAAIVTGQLIIEAWIGHGYDSSVVVMRILCIGYLLSIVAGPVTPLVQGIGRPDYQRNAEVLCLILNVVLSVVLINKFGFYGAPIGTTLAMSVTATYYCWSFHRLMARPLIPFLKSTFLKPASCAVVSGLLSLVVVSALMPYASGSRLAAVSVWLTVGCVFAAFYVVSILKCRYLDDRDIAHLREHLLFIRSWISRKRLY